MSVKTALVVDDSKSARIMLGRMLEKLNLKVELIESGEEALAHLEANPLPDVIFMDHMMPGIDGLQTTKIISTNDRTKHVPIFMYTSKEGPEYEEEVAASGAYGMLGKPAKPERLREIIAELVSITSASTTTITTPTAEPFPAHLEIVSEQDAAAALSDAATEYLPPVTQPEEEPMSKELIREVSSVVVARAIEDALQPIIASIQRLETANNENQGELRKLSSRLGSNVNLVTQAVLDASLRQTTVQLQAQISNEMKSLRDLLEHQADLPPAVLQKIKELASKAGSDAGEHCAEKTASSYAEAVAAKVGAAQAQFQVQKDMVPLIRKAKVANMIAIVALIAAGASIFTTFLM